MWKDCDDLHACKYAKYMRKRTSATSAGASLRMARSVDRSVLITHYVTKSVRSVLEAESALYQIDGADFFVVTAVIGVNWASVAAKHITPPDTSLEFPTEHKSLSHTHTTLLSINYSEKASNPHFGWSGLSSDITITSVIALGCLVLEISRTRRRRYPLPVE